MKIIIFGASGSGTTTLAQQLTKQLNWIHLDADDYYWEKTEPPFQVKVPTVQRNTNLKTDFLNNRNVIISGSLMTWSDYWNTAFDLGVFLRLPQAIRMQRLHNRELERYGATIERSKNIKAKSTAFLDWAKKYDDPSFEGRSINQHKKWIEQLNCKTLEINGDFSINHNTAMVLQEIAKKVD